jgi:hypothetical protein
VWLVDAAAGGDDVDDDDDDGDAVAVAVAVELLADTAEPGPQLQVVSSGVALGRVAVEIVERPCVRGTPFG